MKYILVVLLVLFSSTARAQSNSIEGIVSGSDSRGLQNVRVFLLNGGYSQIGMVYTDTAGRYRFSRLPAAEYYIQVEPAGTDYEPQTQRIQINPLSIRGGGELVRIDFVLTKRANAIKRVGITGNVFYQEVPPAALKEFKEGQKRIEKNDFAKAEQALKKALEIFPDYYDALDLLGSEYIKLGKHDLGVPILQRAIEVNRLGWHSYYSLGVAMLELKQAEDGVRNLRRACELNPESPNANMRLGMALASNNEAQEEAIACFNRCAAKAGKQIPDVYLYLASLYSRRNQYREAIEALENYLKVIPAGEGQEQQRGKIRQVIEQMKQKSEGASKPPNR